MKTVKQFAKELKVSERYVHKLLSQGRIEGAQKLGRDWILPKDARVKPR